MDGYIMEGTRFRILQILQRRGHETVEGLAKAIGLAPATIRRHLDILQRDRLVAFREVRKKTGRPEHAFYLTEEGQEALPKDYGRLLGLMVQEIARLTPGDTTAKDGHQLLELVFSRLSQRIFQEHRDALERGDRLKALLGILSDQEFCPEAEMVGGVIQIRLHNCPYRSIALRNKAVCSLDSRIISDVLQAEATREACIHDGDNGCTYVVYAGAGVLTSRAATN